MERHRAPCSRTARSCASLLTGAAFGALGLLDLVVAVSTGAYASLSTTGAVGEITTRPMAELPLVLIPAYFVPIFIMLHIVALAQARRAAKHAVV